MTLFYLPDLGEGLPDAEIQKWYVNVGDVLKVDSPMVAMETAKAVVDIPVPFNGRVIQLFGKSGDIIKTGAALIEIATDVKDRPSTDNATVVGNLQITESIIEESATGIQPTFNKTASTASVKATPSIRALAKKMQVDLSLCLGTGPSGQITVSDLENATKIEAPSSFITKPRENYEPVRGVRRAMALAMSKSHQTVVPVTLVEDVDIHAWPQKTDVTLRLIRAIMTACQREPRLNAWFDETDLALCQHRQINLGIAMDTQEGLFVPVLKNVAQCSAADLRKKIDEFKIAVKMRNIPPEDLSGATFVLSNVGVFAGRYASAVIVPPTVAILAVGRISETFVSEQGKPVLHKILPLSLTVDHRAVTGGETARFLFALMRDLETP